MNNTKTKEIIKFSFYKNIQNKWFIIFNVLTLISIVLLINWGSISSVFKSVNENEIFEIAVLDNSNLIYDDFLNRISIYDEYRVMRIYENTYNEENIRNNFVIIEVIPDDVECFNVSLISKEGINVNIYNTITQKLYESRNNLFAQKYGVSSVNIEIFQKDLSINRIMLSVNAEDSNIKEIIKLFSSALTYLLTIFVFSKMSNEIASEKQSKSTEYILTTVSEKEYLFAKIFANIAILLIQGIFILIYYFIAVAIMNIINIASTDLTLNTSIFSNSLSKEIVYYILALIIYNVLNLVLLSIVQATLSSKTSSTVEAGNTVSLLIFLMMVAYVATVYIIRPELKVNMVIYIISCLPLLSAYFVPAMMVIGQATWWQIIASILILIVSIPIAFNFCSPIFKNGILDYTKVKKKHIKKKNKENERNKFLIKRDMKNFGFVIGLSVIIYIGTQTIFSLLGSIALPTLFDGLIDETGITLILQIILQVISLGLASIFVFTYTSKKNDLEAKHNIKIKEKIKIVFVSLLAVFSLQFLLSLVIYPAIGLDYDTTDIFNINSDSSLINKIILIVAVAVIPAIFEELFFRKAIIDFSLKYGKKFALVFSALLFGILHMNLSQGLFAFIVGIIFGAIYLYTKDIKFTILIHFINNGFAALELILPEIGALIIAGILIVSLVIGFGVCILLLSKKEDRDKIKNLCKITVMPQTSVSKYKYIFTDFTFDISIILVVLMSILTENILR